MMIENIKKFQEEFKAKYGVDARVQITTHGVRNIKDSRDIIEEFAGALGSDMKGDGLDNVSWFSAESVEIKVSSFYDTPSKWNADFLEELSDDAFRGLTKLFSPDNSEAGQEELVTSYLNTHWERLGIEPTFEQVCDVTEVEQHIVRKMYDRFMNEWKLDEEKAV